MSMIDWLHGQIKGKYPGAFEVNGALPQKIGIQEEPIHQVVTISAAGDILPADSSKSYKIKNLYITAANAAGNAGTEVTVTFIAYEDKVSTTVKALIVPSVANQVAVNIPLNVLTAPKTSVSVVATNIGSVNVVAVYNEIGVD